MNSVNDMVEMMISGYTNKETVDDFTTAAESDPLFKTYLMSICYHYEKDAIDFIKTGYGSSELKHLCEGSRRTPEEVLHLLIAKVRLATLEAELRASVDVFVNAAKVENPFKIKDAPPPRPSNPFIRVQLAQPTQPAQPAQPVQPTTATLSVIELNK